MKKIFKKIFSFLCFFITTIFFKFIFEKFFLKKNKIIEKNKTIIKKEKIKLTENEKKDIQNKNFYDVIKDLNK